MANGPRVRPVASLSSIETEQASCGMAIVSRVDLWQRRGPRPAETVEEEIGARLCRLRCRLSKTAGGRPHSRHGKAMRGRLLVDRLQRAGIHRDVGLCRPADVARGGRGILVQISPKDFGPFGRRLGFDATHPRRNGDPTPSAICESKFATLKSCLVHEVSLNLRCPDASMKRILRSYFIALCSAAVVWSLAAPSSRRRQ